MNNKRTELLTNEEIQKIESYAKNYGSLKNTAALEVLMALYTGMRFSEINNLTWSDVDLINNSVRIVNKTSINKIPVNGIVTAKLDILKKNQYENYLDNHYAPEVDYVFINKKLNRPTQLGLENRVSRALNSDQHISFKVLRDSILVVKEGNNN